ncbi:phage baseplate assembly protein V [Vulcaniibacterium tengchongense]|uniref:Phage baseplate assembly protein V n=1 Tax=Vulcaniibacterium tengchongense TaxID=1273429 RepID=A0A3N4V4I8_9GAMM|nr:phage baseplate assembly protein V [Vulcaniibacterium tengchongense]RPE74629.1 phage baseplate assembly protein V [Vulcaniibacterium tengchongense]
MDPTSELQRQLGNAIRLGTVAEVDLAAARCRVDSGEVRSDWVPWFVPRAGATLEWSAPVAGEQGVLLCPGGDTIGAIFLRGVYSDAFPAPSSGGTLHLVRFPDGATVQYDHEAHALKAALPAGGAAEITADGGVTINGPLTVHGDTEINGNTRIYGDAAVSGTATADADVVGGGKSLKGHRHTGVMAGGAVSGPPA